MPYKQKLKTPAANPRKKPTYKVINWTKYNQSLKKRGCISLYFPYGNLEVQLFNSESYVKGIPGQQVTYKQAYVELIYMFYRLFGWGMRQMSGYFEDLWKTKNLNIPVPSFGHMSDMFATIPVKTKQYCDKLAKRIRDGESISLILDSTGMRFDKASHWYETKYNKPCKNRPWRKLHLSMDLEMNIHQTEITDYEASDIGEMDNLLCNEQSEMQIGSVLADGAYYSKEVVEKLSKKGIIPAIPPPSNAVVNGKEYTTWHDKVVQYIKDKGTVYAFHKKYDYGKRALVEAQISRIKRCIGSSLLTQKIESQKNEGTIVGNIINLWNSFGKCLSVKIG